MRSFATAALAGLVAATPMTDMEFKFINYVAKFGKSYGTTEEYAFRLEQFAKVDQFIQETNAVEQNFTVGHNIFSDYTHAEYKKLLGYKPVQTTSTAEVSNAVPDFATGVNWVTAGAVTPVKDQGHCGSCWSFSSTGALEGAWFVKAGELLSFSEKQLVDCVKACFGCNGGNQTLAFHYYTSHFPMSEAIYPYQPVGGTCQYDVNNSYQNIQVTGAVQVGRDSVAALQSALASQPIAVSIEADTLVFQSYTSGVLDSTACGTTLDHAVLAVGYGVENGINYWLVKNSWGTSWGENGYIKLAAVEGEGICGVQMAAVYPGL
jgi:C1A family cysteine protease